MSQPSTPNQSRRPSGLNGSVTHFHLPESKQTLKPPGATFTTTSSSALPLDVAPTPGLRPASLAVNPGARRPDSLLLTDADAGLFNSPPGVRHTSSMVRPVSSVRKLRRTSSPYQSTLSVPAPVNEQRLRESVSAQKHARNPLNGASPPRPLVPDDNGEGTGLHLTRLQTPAKPAGARIPASSFTTTRSPAQNTPTQLVVSSSTTTTTVTSPVARPEPLPVSEDDAQSPPPPPAYPGDSQHAAPQEPLPDPALTTPPNQEPATPPLADMDAATMEWLRVCARHKHNPEGRLLRDKAQGVHPRTVDEVQRLDQLFAFAQDGARRDAALSGRLDALYTVYASNTPPGIQTHRVARTSATLEAQLELGYTPQTLRLAIFMSRVRDFFSQMSTSMAGYLGSWFAGACTTIAMLRKEVPETVTTPTSAMVIGVGSRATARFIRHAGMAPGWTRAVATDGTRQTVPAIRTFSGFARSTLAYWPFMASLSYVTWGTPDPAHTDSKAQRAQWALDRQEARRYYNIFATLGVGAHRYFTAPDREITWLNALDEPGDPPGYRKHVMKGAIEELTNLEKTAKSAAWYVLARPFIGVWGAFYLGDAWRSIQSTMAQYNPAASAGGQTCGNSSDTKGHHPALEPVRMTEAQAIRARSGNLMMLAGLVAVVAIINLARRTTADYPRGSHFIDSGLDILLLAAWGGIVSSVEVESLENPSIAEESRRLNAQWHLELAQAGGFGPVAEVPGVVNPHQVAPQPDDPEAPEHDEV